MRLIYILNNSPKKSNTQIYIDINEYIFKINVYTNCKRVYSSDGRVFLPSAGEIELDCNYKMADSVPYHFA